MFSKNFGIKNKNGKIYKTFTLLGMRFKFFIGFADSLYVNKYLTNIKPYKASSHKIWEVEPLERKNILKLDWNEAVIPPSPLVRKRIDELLKEPDFLNLYPKTYNNRLLKVISDYVQIPEKNIQYFSSSDSIHEYIAKMYIKENDRVLVQAPSYDNFRLTAEANGAKVFYSEVEPENFSFNEKIFENAIKKVSPTFVYICSPNNPCGYINTNEYLEYLIKKYTGTMFLVDEAYAEFSGISAKELCLRYENILVTRTLSKAFAMANLRFGYLIASKNNIESISSIRNPKNINTFTQETAIAALTDIEYMNNYVKEVISARKYFLEKIKQYNWVKGIESNANFVLLKFENYGRKSRFFEFLKENNVFVRDLVQSPILYDCLRITIGTMDITEKVLDLFKQFEQEEMALVSQKNKIALFDFCDTLVNFQTGNAYIDYIREQKNSLIINFRHKLHKILFKIKIKINKNYFGKMDYAAVIKGTTKQELDFYAKRFYIEKVRPRLIQNSINELKRLQKAGYRIFIVSGGYENYLKYFAEEFRCEKVFATKLQCNEKGIFTGKFDGLDCMGKNKIILLNEYLKDENLKNYDTVAYSDSPSDIPLLKYAKKGYVVVPQGIPVAHWILDNKFEIIKI